MPRTIGRVDASRGLIALVVLAGCAGDPVPIDGSIARDASADRDAAAAPDAPAPPDARPIEDAARTDGGACTPVAIAAPAWLDGYEREVLGALTGERDIAPGVCIRERGTVASRDRAREYLRSELAALGLDVELHGYGSGANVVARLPATIDPGTSLLVIGGHFDGVTAGPAAADNGTGVTLVLAAARWIVEALPCRTRDLEIVMWDEEERGLIGSGRYADRLLGDRRELRAVYAFDMLSWDMDGDRTVEMWLAPPAIVATWEAAAAAHSARVSQQRFSSSDHASFTSRRMPASGFCEEFVGGDTSPHYHTAEDTFDKVDFEFLELATTMAVDAVAREVGAR